MVKRIEQWQTEQGILFDTEFAAVRAEMQHAFRTRLFIILTNGRHDMSDKHASHVLDVLLNDTEAMGILRMYAGTMDIK